MRAIYKSAFYRLDMYKNAPISDERKYAGGPYITSKGRPFYLAVTTVQ